MNEQSSIPAPLHPWQQSALTAWLGNNARGLVAAVTGSGKTMLAVRAAMALGEELAAKGESLSVRVAVPKTFLLSHWRAAFLREEAFLRQDVGLWCGSHKDEPTRPVTLYVLNSARYALARHVLADIRAGRHALLIVDECHHLLGEKNAKILEFLPKLGEDACRYHVLALSATAEAVMRDKDLVTALGGLICRYTLSEALRDGVVSDFMLLPVSVSFTEEEGEEYEALSARLIRALAEAKKLSPALRHLSGADFFAALQGMAGEGSPLARAAAQVLRLSYARRRMMHLAENRIRCACALVLSQPPASRIILFGERIDCARQIRSQLEQTLPGQTALYHSRMGEAAMKASLSRYQSGEARILITCRALDEGLDVPATDVGIAVSSTKTERQRVQRLGRILRRSGSPLPAKLYYIYLDWSSEESIYLEQDFPFPLVPLSFDSERFHSPAAEALAEALPDVPSDPASREELRRQLALCAARGDFALPAALCEVMRERAETRRERNYWTAALLMAKAKETAQTPD